MSRCNSHWLMRTIHAGPRTWNTRLDINLSWQSLFFVRNSSTLLFVFNPSVVSHLACTISFVQLHGLWSDELKTYQAWYMFIWTLTLTASIMITHVHSKNNNTMCTSYLLSYLISLRLKTCWVFWCDFIKKKRKKGVHFNWASQHIGKEKQF